MSTVRQKLDPALVDMVIKLFVDNFIWQET